MNLWHKDIEQIMGNNVNMCITSIPPVLKDFICFLNKDRIGLLFHQGYNVLSALCCQQLGILTELHLLQILKVLLSLMQTILMMCIYLPTARQVIIVSYQYTRYWQAYVSRSNALLHIYINSFNLIKKKKKKKKSLSWVCKKYKLMLGLLVYYVDSVAEWQGWGLQINGSGV